MEDRVYSGLAWFDIVYQRHGCHFTCVLLNTSVPNPGAGETKRSDSGNLSCVTTLNLQLIQCLCYGVVLSFTSGE